MPTQITNPATYAAQHFRWEVRERVGSIVLDRPERKNPLTFASYAELRDLFRALCYERGVRAVVVARAYRAAAKEPPVFEGD